MIVKPFKHQLVSLKVCEREDRVFDMSDPGTGKTLVQILDFAKRNKRTRKCAIVVAPKSLLDAVWADEIKKFAPHLSVSVAYAHNRDEAFKKDADVYVVNTDGVNWLKKQKKGFFDKFDTLIIDEISSFKHHTSMRSRAVKAVKKYFRYRRGLSGTPNSNTITDIWHPMELLDDGKRLGPSFYGFRSAVCTPRQVGPNPHMVQWEDKEGAENVVFDLLRDLTIRHVFEECVDIPEQHIRPLAYHLTPKQMRAYAEMEATQMATLVALSASNVVNKLTGKPSKVSSVTAINAAAVTTKLLQIASGAVYENEDRYHVVDTGRYEMVTDLLLERDHSLCFYIWKHQRDELIRQAEAAKMKYCVLDGETSDKARLDMVRAYQAGFYQVMYAHPQSAAHGITLTRGNTIIWPSPTYNLEHWVQGNKRQHRAGQKRKTEVIVLLAEGTLEKKVYDKLMAKDARMSNLLDLFGMAA